MIAIYPGAGARGRHLTPELFRGDDEVLPDLGECTSLVFERQAAVPRVVLKGLPMAVGWRQCPAWSGDDAGRISGRGPDGFLRIRVGGWRIDDIPRMSVAWFRRTVGFASLVVGLGGCPDGVVSKAAVEEDDCAGVAGGAAYEDNCGVCDDDPTNDCDPDCAGVYGGAATFDDCGTCDDDPTNDCQLDCAGTPYGTAYEDECGDCDDDPSNDCVQDCAGVWGGAAVADMCGTCDDDPSNDCVEDCAGTWGGTALADMCGTCDDDPSNDCVQDCAGQWGGAATTDMWGRATTTPATTAPRTATVSGAVGFEDACGTCDDDPSNDCVADCAGVENGDAVEDACGTCDNDPSNDCVQDCAGVWGGAATTDTWHLR